MGFITRLIAKFILNGVALYVATIYFPAFIISGGVLSLLIGAGVLTSLNLFIRPVLRLISAPLVWLSLGLFNIVINMFLLWLADRLLLELAIQDISTLFWVSIIVALANSLL